MRSRDRERGFTLIEIMVVVALIAILAAVVVPTFFKDTRKTKARSEVNAMFAELSTKEEQYRQDNNGNYLAATACPATPNKIAQDASACIGTGTPWTNMRVQLPEAKLFCSYAITTGTSATTPTPPAGFTMSAPVESWYYIVATCDMDGQTGNSTYFTSSVDSTIQSQNEGK